MICIYAIINVLDDKHYIGQASDRDYRWKEHRKSLKGFYHHSIVLQRAWSKHGEANFIFVVLEILDDVDKLNKHQGKNVTGSKGQSFDARTQTEVVDSCQK